MRGAPFCLFFKEPLLGKLGKSGTSSFVECFTVRQLMEIITARAIGERFTEIELSEDYLRFHALTKLQQLAAVQFCSGSPVRSRQRFPL